MAGGTPKKGGPGVPVDVAALKAAREQKGWSQKVLAREMGCDPRVIERIESRGTAAIQTIADIAEALGVESQSLRPAVAPPAPPAPSVVNRLAQLPGVVADFTGRADEARRMAALLRGDGGRVGVSALRGMGGVGKTSLAVMVAHQVRDHFPDAQLMVELRGTSDQPMTAAEAMARVVRDFHPEQGKLPDDAADLLPLYRSVLAGKRVLVVLDNAKDEEQVRLLVTATPPTGFIVTSRAALALDGVETVRLDVLPPAEALALLRGIVGTKGTDAELGAVADLCGRLPLALRVAGDFLRLHPNWSVPRYTAALADEAERLERLKGKTKDKDVEAVLGLSAAELVKANPEQAERWQLLSVFPADFDAAAATAVWDLKAGDEPDTDTAVDELTALLDRSLIEYDEPTDRYSFHDLMRPIARDAFEYTDDQSLYTSAADRLRAAERRFAMHYCGVLAAADTHYLRGHDNVLIGLALYDREAASIRAGWNWACENRTTDPQATELSRDYPNAGASFLSLRLPAQSRLVWLESAVEACRTLGDRRGEGSALGNLGNAHADLGDARAAITFHEQHLTVARAIGDRRGEGSALGNLGVAHADLGDARTAITFYEQVLAVARELGDRRSEGHALGNLGVAYRSLGDACVAITFHEQRLVIARELGDRRGEGSALGNLGNAHADLGDARAAITFHEQHLTVARAIGDRRGEGSALGNLGVAHADLGDARTAITFYEQVLAVARELGDRRSEASTLGNLGNAHRALGDARVAITFHEQNLVVAREIGNRQGEAIASWNMAIALRDLGQHREAIPFAEQSLAFFESIGHSCVEEDRQTLARWRDEAEAAESG